MQFEGYTHTWKTIRNILTVRLFSELMGGEIIIRFSMVSTQSLWLYTDVFPQLMILHTSMKSKHAFVKNTSEHTGTGNVKMKYWLQTARPNSALIKMCYFVIKLHCGFSQGCEWALHWGLFPLTVDTQHLKHSSNQYISLFVNVRK